MGAVHIRTAETVIWSAIPFVQLTRWRAGYAEAEKDNAITVLHCAGWCVLRLVDRGIRYLGHLAPMAMVGLAFTHSSSDFGNILMDVAHKAALQGWDDASENFDKWTRKER